MTDSPTPGGTPDPVNYQSPPPGSMGDPADVEKNKIMACIGYLGILVLVPLLVAKDSPFAKFHANQGLMLTVGTIALSFALGMVFIVLHFIPVLGFIAGCFGCLLFPALSILYLVLVVLGIMNAYSGKMKPLPMFPNKNFI